MTIVATEQLWDTFETLRDHLFDQFETPRFDPETGVPPEAVELEMLSESTCCHKTLPEIPMMPKAYQENGWSVIHQELEWGWIWR